MDPGGAVSPRPRILFLSQSFPFPPTSGVTNRTYHILKGLQQQFDVFLLSFWRRNHQHTEAGLQRATASLSGEVSHVLGAFSIGSDWSRLAKVWVHARAAILDRPFTVFEYRSTGFGRALQAAVRARRPDLIHLDSIDLDHWRRVLDVDCPVTCTHHSIESDLLRQRIPHVVAPLRPYLWRQAALLERLERRVATDYAVNIMMSQADAERLRRLAPGAVTAVVPNGVDTGRLQPTPPEQEIPDCVGFLGPSYMTPNRDGVVYFLEEIWPLIRARRTRARFCLIGRVSPRDRAEFERHPGVTCKGFVEDLGGALSRIAVCVVPLRIGGGTRLKILDAWAAGRAVVSTTVGCEGLASTDGDNLLVRDDPDGFASAVCSLLEDSLLRRNLGIQGRHTVESLYDWDQVGAQICHLYRAVVQRS